MFRKRRLDHGQIFEAARQVEAVQPWQMNLPAPAAFHQPRLSPIRDAHEPLLPLVRVAEQEPALGYLRASPMPSHSFEEILSENMNNPSPASVLSPPGFVVEEATPIRWGIFFQPRLSKWLIFVTSRIVILHDTFLK